MTMRVAPSFAVACVAATLCLDARAQELEPRAFSAAPVGTTFVLGGLGDMAGALIAALIIAAVEVIGSYTIGTSWKEVLYLLLFIAILVVRPAGLFGQRGSETLGV